MHPVPSHPLVCMHGTHPCLRICLKLSLFLFASCPFSPSLSLYTKVFGFPSGRHRNARMPFTAHTRPSMLAHLRLPACPCTPAALALVLIKGTQVLKRQPVPVTPAGYPYSCWCLSILVLKRDHQATTSQMILHAKSRGLGFEKAKAPWAKPKLGLSGQAGPEHH